ncbi:DUF736 domain-containing protein [Hyphomonas sp. CY54-11-8]|uniref:DUF736 domain-containing protein n=1 Tax=Hyphomonas sp. CY54-11-8 TaxID=1280944 RepID=UPI000553BE96|nr:DUF736 domain-containing protein [Hyphomonas sp. CY54-11-8]
MANALGYINETETGFEGTLAMMSLTAPIRIVRNDRKTAEKQPDYRVYAGQPSADIGGGWLRTAASSGREYVSLTLSAPMIGPRKLYATIAPVKGQDGRHVILWNPAD